MIHTFRATLTKRIEFKEVYWLTFGNLEAPLEFEAGQYVIVHVPQKDADDVRRLYSMANPSTLKDRIEMVVKKIPGGIGSEYLGKLPIGQQVSMQGPAGIFTLKPTSREMIMLATGTGIAPLRSMLLTRAHAGKFEHSIQLVWGLHQMETGYVYDDLVGLSDSQSNFRFTCALSQEHNTSIYTQHQHCICDRIDHYVERTLIEWTRDPDRYEYYICGSIPVINTLQKLLIDVGIARELIHFEKFT